MAAQGRAVCPTHPDHGRLLEWTGQNGKDYYCSHVGHEGRGKSHPGGEAPRTKMFFSYREVFG